MRLLAVVFFVFGSALANAATCDYSTIPIDKTTPLNRLVLQSAAQLLPASVRPGGYEYKAANLQAIKAGPVPDERYRERIVEALVVSAWFLKQANLDRAAIRTLHHLAQLLTAYDDAEYAQTRKDNAMDLFHIGKLLAKFGDKSGAQAVIDKITASRREFEKRAGVYTTAQALIAIYAARGEKAKAREELSVLAKHLLAEYSSSQDVSWAYSGLVAIALGANFPDMAAGFLDRGKALIGAIDAMPRRASMAKTYARLQEAVDAVAAGMTLQDFNQAQIDASRLPFAEELARARQIASELSRGEAIAKLIDRVKRFLSVSQKQRDKQLEQIVALVMGDSDILRESPVSMIIIAENLSRVNRFADADELLQRACDMEYGRQEYEYGPALHIAQLFITHKIAMPDMDDYFRSFGIDTWTGLLVAPMAYRGFRVRQWSNDPFPRLPLRWPPK
jgi:hypothetical protein